MKEESSEEKLVEETDGEAGGSRVALVFLRAGALRRGASVAKTVAVDSKRERTLTEKGANEGRRGWRRVTVDSRQAVYERECGKEKERIGILNRVWQVEWKKGKGGNGGGKKRKRLNICAFCFWIS